MDPAPSCFISDALSVTPNSCARYAAQFRMITIDLSS
jgi:hypothetical protein